MRLCVGNTLLLVCALSILPATAGTSSAFSQAVPAPVQDKGLIKVVDVPMPGAAVRFDYQSLDAVHKRLYLSHMDADEVVVFDVAKREVIANLSGFKNVHGVLVVPELNRLYTSNTGDHRLAAVDTTTLKIVATAGPILYPDGIAYAPKDKKVFVSDEHGNLDAVIDATTNKLIAKIELGGEAGNTVYDANANRILVAVHGTNELVSIDPSSNQITGRYPLPSIRDAHGIALDLADQLAFVAGERSNTLTVVDLKTMKNLSTRPVGAVPDVLAFDPGLKRLYVACESGAVDVFQQNASGLHLLSQLRMPHAHTVSVDPATHLVYLPLENIDGHPVLRIMRPADQP